MGGVEEISYQREREVTRREVIESFVVAFLVDTAVDFMITRKNLG